MSNHEEAPPVLIHVSGTAQEPNLGQDYNAYTVRSYDDGMVMVTEARDGGMDLASITLYEDQVDGLIAALQRHKERVAA